MRKLLSILVILFSALGATGSAWAAAPQRYPVELALKVQDHDTHTDLLLPARKGYTYEVSEQLTDIAVLRVFNSEGQALDGYYEITLEELRQILNKRINAGIKATSAQPAPAKCESCQVGDAQEIPDRRPAIQKPTSK